MTIKYLLIALAAVIILFPIYEMISTSLKLPVDAFVIPPVWFFVPTLINYKAILLDSNFFRFFANSVIVALSSTVLSVGLGALAAYPLARWRFGGKKR